MKTKFPRAQAIEVARFLHEALKEVTERIIFAGSLRRMKQQVGDVEVLYVPKWIEQQIGLFPGDVQHINQVDVVLEELRHRRILRPRLGVLNQTCWGPKNKLAEHIPSGIPVDLFSTSTDCWWNYLVCRTGGEQTNRQIAVAAQQRGWKWNPYRDGFTDENGRAIRVESEKQVFDLVGLPYRKPEDRP